MTKDKQQESIDKLKELEGKNLPENVRKSIAEKQKALESNRTIRK